MKKLCFNFVIFLCINFLFLSCGSDSNMNPSGECTEGAENCPCTAEGDCEDGLICDETDWVCEGSSEDNDADESGDDEDDDGDSDDDEDKDSDGDDEDDDSESGDSDQEDDDSTGDDESDKNNDNDEEDSDNNDDDDESSGDDDDDESSDDDDDDSNGDDDDDESSGNDEDDESNGDEEDDEDDESGGDDEDDDDSTDENSDDDDKDTSESESENEGDAGVSDEDTCPFFCVGNCIDDGGELADGTCPEGEEEGSENECCDFGVGYQEDLDMEHEGPDYYVALNGQDIFPGTEELPFKSIRKAAATVEAGGTVYIRGGVYNDDRWIHQLDPLNSGTENAWITYRNYPGELPIIDGEGIDDGSGVEPLTNIISYVRFEGLVSRNWKYSGFANGWDPSSDHMEFKYCVADNNGVNGIAFYKAEGVRIEYSIVSRNGHTPPSWSSGVNIYDIRGDRSKNVIKGNVSFSNVDVCGIPDKPEGECNDSYSSDGNGFVIDESPDGSCLFQNNIAFNNGGSCIRLTHSPGTHIINNTCYHNCQDNGYGFSQNEIYFSENTSTQNVYFINNLVETFLSSAINTNITTPRGENNVFNEGGSSGNFFTDADRGDFSLSGQAGSNVVNAGKSDGAASDDIGFDYQCIKPEQGEFPFFYHAPDYDYIESIGGVAACFNPKERDGQPDIGAFER